MSQGCQGRKWFLVTQWARGVKAGSCSVGQGCQGQDVVLGPSGLSGPRVSAAGSGSIKIMVQCKID